MKYRLYNNGLGDKTDDSLHNSSYSGSISRWKFNGNITDSWSDNDVTASNVEFAEGVRGKSLNAANSDELIVSDSQSLEIQEEMTVSAWIKPNKQPKNMSTGYPMIWRKPNGGDDGSVTFGILESDTNRLGVRISTGDSNTNPDLRVSFSDLSWHHFVATYNQNTLRLYKNGVEIASRSATTTINTNNQEAGIGKGWEGKIDDLRVYSKCLNKDQVYDLYQWGCKGDDLRHKTTTSIRRDMQARWKLNETSGSTAYDSSGNGNNGYIKGGAGPSGTGTVNGIVTGGAYTFDGENDHIQVLDTQDFTNLSQLTISTWIKPRQYPQSYSTTFRPIIAKGDSNDWEYQLARRSGQGSTGDDDQIFFGINSGNGDSQIYNSLPIGSWSDILGEWHHVVGVFNGHQQMLRVYWDGVEVLSNTTSVSSTPSNNGKVRIAWDGDTSNDRYNPMDLDDPRIYKRALTPQEVSYLYEQRF